MKRNWDTVRRILLAVEASENPHSDHSIKQWDGFDESEYWRHLVMMREADLIYSDAHLLTWTGHELLDSIRSDTTWNRVKTAARDKGIGLTIKSIFSLSGWLFEWSL